MVYGENPHVTVVVPLYNTEPYVSECLESLLAQTMPYFEAICVNDGSTDETAKIARATVAGDNRFTFIDQENKGLSAARNRGITNARGDYICFLDSDDYLDARALEVLFSQAEKEELDLLDFSAMSFYEDSYVKSIHEEDYTSRKDLLGIVSGPTLYVHYWETRSYKSSACLHFIRKAYLSKLGLLFCEGLLHEDELFTPLLYTQAKRAAFCNQHFYMRRMRHDSIMTRGYSQDNLQAINTIVGCLHEWLQDNNMDYSKAFNKAFSANIAMLETILFNAVRNLDTEEFDTLICSLDRSARANLMTLCSFGTEIASRAHNEYEAHLRDVGIKDSLRGLARAVKRRFFFEREDE